MAANTTPVFTITPHITFVRINTANTNRDGTGTISDLITATTNGTRIDRIVCTATSTTTAGMLRFYIHDTTDNRLWKEELVTAITPSGTVKAWTAAIVSPELDKPLLVLQSTWKLRVSTVAAETFDIICHAADY